MAVLTSLAALVTISVEPIPPGRVAPVIIRFTILLMITMPKKDNTEPMTDLMGLKLAAQTDGKYQQSGGEAEEIHEKGQQVYNIIHHI